MEELPADAAAAAAAAEQVEEVGEWVGVVLEVPELLVEVAGFAAAADEPEVAAADNSVCCPRSV